MHAESLLSCSALFDLLDCSTPGSSVREILQERILEWAAMPFSKRDIDAKINISGKIRG